MTNFEEGLMGTVCMHACCAEGGGGRGREGERKTVFSPDRAVEAYIPDHEILIIMVDIRPHKVNI